MEEKECVCSFCKLREIGNKNTLEDLRYLKERREKIVRENQERNIELIELCVKSSNPHHS